MNAEIRQGSVRRGNVPRAGDSRANAGVTVFRRGDVVVAAQHLGRRGWRSGVPVGTVGVVMDTDWLGDLRVEFTLDGSWFAGTCTVLKLVAPCDVCPARPGA